MSARSPPLEKPLGPSTLRVYLLVNHQGMSQPAPPTWRRTIIQIALNLHSGARRQPVYVSSLRTTKHTEIQEPPAL